MFDLIKVSTDFYRKCLAVTTVELISFVIEQLRKINPISEIARDLILRPLVTGISLHSREHDQGEFTNCVYCALLFIETNRLYTSTA